MGWTAWMPVPSSICWRQEVPGAATMGGVSVVVGLHGLADGREEEHLADGQGCLVMLFLVAEGACHAAAGGGDDVQVAAWQQAQHGGSLVDAYDGFLVAVAVEPYLDSIATELVGGDVAAGHFAHDEFVVEEAVAPQAFCLVAHGGWAPGRGIRRGRRGCSWVLCPPAGCRR